LKEIFSSLIFKAFNKNSSLNGIKFSISGRLLGKPRYSVVKILIGKMPCQTISKNIIKQQIHVYTIYGVFGFKIWIN
jgi:ribosomal protein S3